MIGSYRSRFLDIPPVTLLQRTYVLLDLALPFLLAQIHAPLNPAHPFDRRRTHPTLLQEAQRLVIHPVHRLAQVPQHTQHREPVYRVNDEALSFLQQCGMSAAAIERVSRIQWGVDLSEEEWQ